MLQVSICVKNTCEKSPFFHTTPLFISYSIISTAEDTSSLSGFLQILQEKQKTDYFYKYRSGLNNFGI